MAHKLMCHVCLYNKNKMLIRFILYGLGGWCGEIIFTAVTESLPRRDWRLVGTTYLWMFPIYGLLAPLYEPIHDLIRSWHWGTRAIVWSLGFTLIELVTGWGLDRMTGKCPWDYSNKKYAINAYIRWDFFPIWAIVGLLIEPIHDFLVTLTPAIEQIL